MEKKIIASLWPTDAEPRLIRSSGTYKISPENSVEEKYNKSSKYIKDISIIKGIIDLNEFPEAELEGVKGILTNDGILAFQDGSTTIIYDLKAGNPEPFNVDENANINMLRPFRKDDSLRTYYMLSVSNGKFVPYKIADNLFNIDCDEIEGFEKTEDGYFVGTEEQMNNITTIKIKRQMLYHISKPNGIEVLFDGKAVTGDYIICPESDALINITVSGESSGIVELW